jgi:hypothetical protein
LKYGDEHWRIILKPILKKWNVGAWNGFLMPMLGEESGFCECGTEISGFHKMGAVY